MFCIFVVVINYKVQGGIVLGILKTAARKIAFPLIVNTGLERLLSASAANDMLILVYHGVVEKPDHSISAGPIDVYQFEQHLAYFKKYFNVVSLNHIFEMYRTGTRPKRKTIAITFDDGYENNYLRAVPLLKQYNFPATIFVIGNSVENDNTITWYDHLFFIQHRLNYKDIDTSVVGQPSVSSLHELIRLIQRIDLDKRLLLYKELDKQVKLEEVIGNYPREFWKLMTATENRDLSRGGLIEIAAHSYSHPNLGEIALPAAIEELKKSKQLLEEAIAMPVQAIAYPDGSYTDEVKKASLDAGYKNLLAVDYRCASDAADKNILPRYCISSTTTFESNIIAVNRAFKTYGF